MSFTLNLAEIDEHGAQITWDEVPGADTYRVYWADRNTKTMQYRFMSEQKECRFHLNKSTHVPHFLYVEAAAGDKVIKSEVLRTPLKRVMKPQLEKLNRGLIAVKAKTGIFLGWRMLLDEVKGYSETGMTGTDYVVYKNGNKLAVVTDSTNYIDKDGTMEAEYSVAPICGGIEGSACRPVKAWSTESNYIEIPMHIPEGGTTE